MNFHSDVAQTSGPVLPGVSTNLHRLGRKYVAQVVKRDAQMIELQGWLQATITSTDGDMPNNSNPLAAHARLQFADMEFQRLYRFGFTFMLDADWQWGGDETNLMDFHSRPDRGDIARQGPVNLILAGDKLVNQVFTDPDRITSEQSEPVVRHEFQAYRGVPMRLEWLYRPGYADVHRPFYALFVDGERVVTYSEPNAFNDHLGPYPMAGLYQWSWDGAPERRAYFTDFVYEAR